MNFVTRAKRDETEVAERRIWRSLDAPYLVIESKSKFGLPLTYYAIVVSDSGEQQLVSRHRTRQAAENACVNHWLKKDSNGQVRPGRARRMARRPAKGRKAS